MALNALPVIIMFHRVGKARYMLVPSQSHPFRGWEMRDASRYMQLQALTGANRIRRIKTATASTNKCRVAL